MASITRDAGGYIADLWKLRYFWLSLVKVDLRTRYRRSFFGLGWSLLKPVFMTTVMCVVFSSLLQADIWDYGPFVLIGMTFWGFMTETILGGCLAFHHGEGYLRQVKLPVAIFPLRVAVGAGFHFAVLLPVVVIGLSLIGKAPGPLALLSVLAAIILLFVLGWALAILSGLLTVHFPDMRHILELVLQIVFYLTPIIYPAEILARQRVGRWLLDLNPFAYLLELVRRPLLEGVPASVGSFGVAIAFTLICVALAMFALGRLEKRLVFWL